MNNDKICQSCGMPMAAIEHFGTNADKSMSKEYCCFCFQNGILTDNFHFEEFVEDAVKGYTKPEQLDGHWISKDELMIKEKVKLLSLKRWTSHERTHQEYYKSVNRAVEYINNHLDKMITLSELAKSAAISEYHFHRIFKAILNESPGDYIQRLRLEKVSFLLQTSTLSIYDIAEQTGYQSAPALSKAFKKRYGTTPSAFRTSPADLTIALSKPVKNLYIQPVIKTIFPKEVLYTRIIDPFHNKEAFRKAWAKLIQFAELNGIPNNQDEYYCISHDISTITNPKHYRLYACIHTPKKIKPKGIFGIQTIQGGLYAVFTHKGPYKDLETIYCNIYRYWIPNNDYGLRDTIHFEKFLNSPDTTSKEELLTEIYIPIIPFLK